jgi:putative tryptophan/tyrosine transport system substrate-binding protein
MRRREFIAALGGAAAWPVAFPLPARAQHSTGQRRVGILLVYEEGNPAAQGYVAAFRETLAKLGWATDRNIRLEYRWAGPDKNLIQQAARELVALQPDLIVSAGSSPATATLLHETSTIPILFVNIVDPVGQGFVASLARPGGNATGFVNLETSMAGKWLEILKEIMPRLTRVGVPFNLATSPFAGLYLTYFKSTAQSLGAEIIAGPVPDRAALETFVAQQARKPNTGLVPVPSAFISAHSAEFAAMAQRYHLPAISYNRAFAKAGGLVGYGNDIADNYRHAAAYADRILKGEKPSELPVQFPVKFDLVINLKTAKGLGLTVPLALQAQADEVIE